MKNSLLLLAGAAALSLASCSQTSTTETATTTTPAGDSTATKTTTTTAPVMTEAMYHTRGDRMATKFATANKITDKATLEKLKTAYYERAKRYDMMMTKFKSDTAGMGAARRQYYQDTNKEFQTILVVPAQYQTYQSSQSDYDESSNMDVTEQGGTSSGSMASDSSSSTSGASSSSATSGSSDMGSGAGVEKSKSKMADGSKVKVKTDGTVKMKDADGTKTKM